LTTLARVGLFGGSFDPPHRAHAELARTAMQSLALDQVRWIPAGQPWQKTRRITDAVHRDAMVRLVIAGEPGWTLDRIELERSGPSLTLDTVTTLQTQEPGTEWVLLIGGDQYANLHTWHGWEDLLSRVTLAVAHRPGLHAQPSPAVLGHPHRVVPLPMLDISSTDIRQRVSQGRDIRQLVSPAVAGYIDQHRLYMEGKAH
jgi:nicotinate-nucleotide adenylyltransferase